MAHRAVVIEDDPALRDLIQHVLEVGGLETAPADNGADGLRLVRDLEPDLVTLDLGLPDMRGTEVCRQLRAFTDAYVVMITGRHEETERVLALDLGADDYLTKPFSPRELTARVTALLRRPRVAGELPAARRQEDEEVLEAGGGLVLAPVRRVAILDGEPVPLTPTEVDVLAALAREPGRTWSRHDLAGEVWDGEFIESDFLVDVHVASLRRKLRRAGGRHDWIRTVDGTGYALALST